MVKDKEGLQQEEFDRKVIKNVHKQMGRRRRATRGTVKGRNRRWRAINRWSDKFKCFLPQLKIERLRG